MQTETKEPLLKQFNKLAKYMPDSPKMKYQLRYGRKFICAESTELLFEKFKALVCIS